MRDIEWFKSWVRDHKRVEAEIMSNEESVYLALRPLTDEGLPDWDEESVYLSLE